MSAFVWTGVTLLGAVAVVVGRWRDWWLARVALRQAQHDALVDAILAEDPAISQLEACLRLPAYERQEHPR